MLCTWSSWKSTKPNKKQAKLISSWHTISCWTTPECTAVSWHGSICICGPTCDRSTNSVLCGWKHIVLHLKHHNLFFFSSSKLSLPEPGRSSVTCPGLPTDIPGDKALSGTPQILLQCCYGPGLETLNQSSQAGSNHGVSKAADYDND